MQFRSLLKCDASVNKLSRCLHTRVLSFGDGSNGALGDVSSFTNDAFEPTEVHGLPSNVVGVSCGHYHSIAVTACGEVWSWGRNNEGQLGRGFKSILSAATIQPEKVKGLEGIKVCRAAASGVISIAISEDGSLWVWGSSKRGQLGLGYNVTTSLAPLRMQSLSGKRVTQVALGWGHVLASTDEGELYSWGYHDEGRLGYVLPSHSSSVTIPESMDPGEKMLLEQWQKEDSPILQWEPRLVELPSKCRVVQVACGLDHSLALTDDYAVYSFGDNSTGQLGRPVDGSVIGTVQTDLINQKVILVNAGMSHSVAVASSNSSEYGVAYSWGWSSAFQLGRSTIAEESSSAIARRIEGMDGKNVIWIGGGRVHSMCITADGKLWTWGNGRNGRLGHGNKMDQEFPALVEDIESVQAAACGFDHNLLLVES